MSQCGGQVFKLFDEEEEKQAEECRTFDLEYRQFNLKARPHKEVEDVLAKTTPNERRDGMLNLTKTLFPTQWHAPPLPTDCDISQAPLQGDLAA